MGVSCCQEFNTQIIEILEIHNRKRALHQSPPLKINLELNKLAQECAKKISKNEIFVQTFNGEFLGENIYIYKGIEFEVNEMCKEWYDEIKKYDQNCPQYQKNTSHFTQMIWRDTKEIGIGIEKKGGICYAVVNYYPPGNILGEYEDNVFFKND